MDIQTTSEVVTTTTKTHKAVFSADEIKNVALLTAKDKAGVADSIDSSDVVIGDGGSITMVIVETIRETSGEGGDTAYEKADEIAKFNAAEMDSPPPSQAPVISVSNMSG